ncbi:hypothetical protein ACHAWF_001563, partial [Thalassiosira exigua]
SCAEAQPLYTKFPHGICVAHNGNLTNAEVLAEHCRQNLTRHINTDSDSEVLLNIFADSMIKQEARMGKYCDLVETISSAVKTVVKSCKGGYAGMYLINVITSVGFRDPHGIRPIFFGERKSQKASNGGSSTDFVFASESVAIDTLGFELVRDLELSEAIVITMDGKIHARRCLPEDQIYHAPCILEYVYLAPPIPSWMASACTRVG